MANRFYFRFLPLAIFDVSARAKGIGATWAAAIALIVALAIALPSIRDHRITGLEAGTIGVFGFIGAIGVLIGNSTTFDLYARAVAASGFGAVALGSVLLTPISQSYTKSLVPRRQWSRSIFREVNVKVSSVWGIVFVAIALSDVLGEVFGSPFAVTVGEWIAPIFLALIGCTFTERCISKDFDLDAIGV